MRPLFPGAGGGDEETAEWRSERERERETGERRETMRGSRLDDRLGMERVGGERTVETGVPVVGGMAR